MSPSDRFEIYPDRMPDPDVLEHGSWVEATGGNLEGPILVRVGRSRDGRPIITGLLIGEFDDSEITADTLRAIRPRALLAQLFEDFDPSAPPADDFGAQIEWGLMQEHVWSPAEEPDSAKQAPPRGPSLDQLHEFASTYQRERVRNPGRAMTSAAEAMHVSRATANRWAVLCREKGLLPPKTEEG